MAFTEQVEQLGARRGLGEPGHPRQKQLGLTLGLVLALSPLTPDPCSSHVLRRCRPWLPVDLALE